MHSVQYFCHTSGHSGVEVPLYTMLQTKASHSKMVFAYPGCHRKWTMTDMRLWVQGCWIINLMLFHLHSVFSLEYWTPGQRYPEPTPTPFSALGRFRFSKAFPGKEFWKIDVPFLLSLLNQRKLTRVLESGQILQLYYRPAPIVRICLAYRWKR